MTAQDPVREDREFAAALRGFGPLGLLAIAVVLLPGNVGGPGFFNVPVSGLLVLAWARLSLTPLAALGFSRPKSWTITLLAGVALGVTLKLVMKAVVLPLLGVDPINQAYHLLAHNPALLPGAVFSMLFAAGFGEEATFRGFAFERLGRLLGEAWPAKLAILLITTAWFAVVHYPHQGLAGVEQAAVMGLVYGGLYLATGRLWLSMVTHAVFDLTALALIYFEGELAVAHWVFR
jgi:membrane protease YdiL (CAAX protease family)